jgi:hypothetical protein
MMTSKQGNFIKVAVAEGSFQTMPVDEAKRLAESEISIEIADGKDAYRVVSREVLVFL